MAKAFGIFSEGKSDVKYYHHAGIEDAGWNIKEMARRCGWGDKLVITSAELSPQKYVTDEVLNYIYNAADVGVNSCYAANTQVLTTNGHKNIEDIVVGDEVFSHTGKISKVVNTFKHPNESSLLRISCYGIPDTVLTENHQLWADSRQYSMFKRPYKNSIREAPHLRFIPAKYLNIGSLLTYPVINIQKEEIDPKLGFIYGAFLAEGSVRKDGIVFSLNQGDSDNELRNKIIQYMKDVFSLEAHIYNMERNRQNITFYSTILREKFKMFGHEARNKRIPNEFLYWNKEAKIQLLYAFILGDGHFVKKAKHISMTTTSKELAWGLWTLFTTLGHIAPAIAQRTRGEWVLRLYGESANHFCELTEHSRINTNKQQRDKMWATDKYIFYPIKNITKEPAQKFVYDLEVSDEHSYLTYVAGHNSEGEGWGLCFASDTKVLTSTGYKSIQNVKIGDSVYDMSGNTTVVTNILEREFTGSIQKIKIAGYHEDILVTPEHPFYTLEGFKEAKDIVRGSDFILRANITKQDQFSKVDLTHYGTFKADNKYIYLVNSGSVGFPVNNKELSTARLLYNKYLSKKRVKKINRFYSIEELVPIFMAALEASSSMLRRRVYKTPETIAFYEKFFNCKILKSNATLRSIEQAFFRVAFTSQIYLNLSREALQEIFDRLISRAYVHPAKDRVLFCAVPEAKRNVYRIILGRLGISYAEFIANKNRLYITIAKKYLDLDFRLKIRNPYNSREEPEGYYHRVVNNTTEQYSGKVYNLETESHTYNVQGYVVHNCNMEHSITGKPQIIPAHSANLEVYADGRGLLVPVSYYTTNTKILTEGAVVSPEDMASAMDYLYNNREEATRIGQKAREYFLQDMFKWENIADKFKEILE